MNIRSVFANDCLSAKEAQGIEEKAASYFCFILQSAWWRTEAAVASSGSRSALSAEGNFDFQEIASFLPLLARNPVK